MTERQEYNIKILKILFDRIMEKPDIRFIQHLWNLRLIDRKDNIIIDRFYEEPDKTLERIKGENNIG